MIYLFCIIIQISPDSREISGDVQKSVILPMLRRTSELPSQKNNKDTCYWFELEFKTGDFVFQTKRRDKSIICLFVEFWRFLYFRSEHRLEIVSQPSRMMLLEVDVIIVLSRFPEDFLLQVLCAVM